MLCCCCRDSHKGSERPGLGLETTEVSLFSNRMFWAAAAEGALVSFFFSFSCFLPKRKKKEPVVWNHATYKQAVRKAMFARFNELDWKWMNKNGICEHTCTHTRCCVVRWQLFPGFNLWTDTKFLEKLIVTNPSFCGYGDVCLYKMNAFFPNSQMYSV